MRHLKAVDTQHTVIMVQVENEPGSWNTVRDYSPEAQKLFTAPVPPELLKAMGTNAPAGGGNWPEVFGTNADEYFHAWSVAHFIGQVAAAGKKEYPLPMYVNAALRDPLTPGPANTYESGGATDNVLWIWKAAAPAIDLLAPDIYQGDSARYLKVLELYSRPDNTLFVPETRGSRRIGPDVFRGVGTRGHRLVALRPRLHHVCQPADWRVAVDGGVARPGRAELQDSGADHARSRPAQFRGQTPGGRRGTG